MLQFNLPHSRTEPKTMATGSSIPSDYGAFVDKFTVSPQPSSSRLPLQGLTFAVKDIFEMEGRVTGFGNPDWARTHPVATSTAPAVLSLLKAGATCVGRTVMDEMAYRVPGGSSSGSAVAVGAKLADFALGTDTGGSVRVPASYCGIYGFRPSHGIITTSGVVPMAQSFDTVGWFARDVTTLKNVGKILLQSSEDDDGDSQTSLGQLIIAEDCFDLLDVPSSQLTQILVSSVEKLFGSDKVKYTSLGNFIDAKVPSLKHFVDENIMKQEDNIPSLAAISSAMRLLQRYEFKNNHGEWVRSVKPKLGPGIAQRVIEALETTNENINEVHCLKSELVTALSDLLGDYGILAMPTVPGPPPKLQTDPKTLESFRAKAFSLLSVAGMSGFCQVLLISLISISCFILTTTYQQVSIPLGTYENLPISVSLLAKHSSDRFLLRFVEAIHESFSQEL